MESEDPQKYTPNKSMEILEKDKHFEFVKLSKVRDGVNSQIKIVERNSLELTMLYCDSWPLLNFRREIMIFISKFQRFCFLVVTSKPFESFSLIIILLNSVFMIVSDPNNDQSIINKSEMLFFSLYTAELLLKLIGMGLFTKKIGFFRNSWNVLDFLIVSGSAIDIIFKDFNFNLSALRALRVLRPLKTVSSVKSLKNIILTIFSSLPFLKDILIILFFFLILFGITGLHLFQGVFHSTCFDPTDNSNPLNNLIIGTGYCSSDDTCPGNSICLDSYQNPFYGQTSFDNIFMSIMMVFQCSTTENWSWIMYSFYSGFTTVMSVIATAYFLLIIILLNFVIDNLMLAVIVVKFNEAHESIEKRKAEVLHSEFCNCHSGFNYSQMKTCGYFLSFSNLTPSLGVPISGKRFTYDLIENLKPTTALDINPDFRFQIVETLIKQQKEEKDPNAYNYATVFSFKKKKTIKETSPTKLKAKKSINKMSHKVSILEQNFGISRKTSEIREAIFKETGLNESELFNTTRMNEKRKTEIINEANEQEEEDKISFHSSLGSSQSYSFDEQQFRQTNKEAFVVKKSILKKESINVKTEFVEKVDQQGPNFPKPSSKEKFDSTFEPNFQKKYKRANFENIINLPGRGRIQPSNVRRNANVNLDKKEIQQGRRISFRPVQINIDQNQSELEKLDIKKEQIKAEKEFNNFMNSNLNLLKLDMDYCKNLSDELYDDVKSVILHSLESKKKLEMEKKKKEELFKSIIVMVYNKKYIIDGEHFDCNNSEMENSESLPFSKNNIEMPSLSQNSVRDKQLIKVMSRNAWINSTKNLKSKLLYYDDLSKTTGFYFYSMNCSYLITDTHEKAIRSRNSTVVPLKSDSFRKMKPSICMHKSKNFMTIKTYFNEEFLVNSVKDRLEIGLNSLLFQNLINDSIQKKRIMHTNWSGSDLQVYPASKFNKTLRVFETLNEEIYEIWLPGFIGKLNIFRRMIRQVFANSYVEFFFISLVLLNTVILSMNGLMTDTTILDTINTALTMIFTVEIVFKFIGLGPFQFYREIFNVFDLMIVALSLIEIALQTNSQVLSAIKVIRVLRTVRVLRASRILRNLKFMRTLIKIFEITLEQFVYTTLLLLLFLSIFSLIGNQLYSGKWTFLGPGEPMIQNFETFYDSFLVMLSVMSIVNWNDALTYLARTDMPFPVSCLYLVTWIFIGNYILLNLFIAVLLDGFSSAVSMNQLEDLNNEFEGLEKAAANIAEEQRRKIRIEAKNSITSNQLFCELKKNESDIQKQKEIIKNAIIYNYDHTVNVEKDETGINDKIIATFKEDEIEESDQNSENDISKYIFNNPKQSKNHMLIYEQIVCEESLFLFKKDGFIRRCFIYLVSTTLFEYFILFTIFVSSTLLVITTYSDDTWTGSSLQRVLDIVDYTVNGIFIMECVSKIIAFGFFWCDGSYLRDNWSILDFIIVCTSILDMLLASTGTTFLRVLKIIRTLRPLRVLSHNPNLKIVIQCLIQSFTGILNVAVVVFMVWLMFAILGMNLMAGKMGYCNFPDNRSYYYVNVTMCPDLNGIWTIRGVNFDNIFSALSMMFIFSNGENWNTYTYYMMDADDETSGPSPGASYLFSIYCIVVIFTSTFFLTKLFIGVIYSEFDNEQKRISKQNFRVVSDEQIKWIQMQKMIKAALPNYVEVIIPQNRFRLFMYKMVTSPSFEWFIMVMIMGNLLSLSVVYWEMNPLYSQVLTYFGYIFTSAFIFEAICKIIALGFFTYLDSNWNKFDFTIVIFSIVDILLTEAVNIQGISIYPLIGRIMRILRVTRIFKMLKSKKLEGINKIIKTLFYSVPAILNVTLVLFLVYFIYAVLGVFLFKGSDPAYQNFGTAALFLFKSSTGELWPDYMYLDQQINMITGSLFWLSFVFLTSFTLMNLFMSVIIDQFSNFYFNSENPINSFEEIVEEFRTCWLIFTAKQKGERIKNKDLLNFFVCLKSPLGFHIPLKKETSSVYGDDFSLNYFQNTLKFDLNFVRRKISEMQLIEDKEGYVSFGQVLHASLKNAFGKNCYKNSNSETCKQIKKIELKTIAKLFNKKIENYDITFDKDENKVNMKARMSNPFNSVLFSQMIFQIWYNHTKVLVGNEEISSEDLEDLLNKNPYLQFEKQILKKSRNSIVNKLRNTFQEDKKLI